MLDELAISLQMPLGNLAAIDAATLLASLQVEKIYGLITTADTDEFSHTLSISAIDDDTSRCHAMMKGRVKLNLETSELEFQTLPFELVQFGNLLPGSPLPVTIIYSNIDMDAVGEAFTSILNPDASADGQAKLDTFLAGDKWVTVKSGSYVCKGLVNGSLRRVIDISFKEQSGLFLNPAHYLFRFPDIDETLTDHPLLLTLQTVQGTAILPSTSTTHYVSRTGATAASPYSTRATAAYYINDALVIAQPGDTVLVLDTSVYDEVVDIPTGVKLMSVAGNGLTQAVGASDVLPVIDHSGLTAHAVIFDGVKGSHISGFRIRGDTVTQGCGVMVFESNKIEIKNCIIQGNLAISGAGMHITGSSKVEVSSNYFLSNKSEDPDDGTYGGGGGGLYVNYDCDSIHVVSNTFDGNRATSFGGAIGVYGAKYVKIEKNIIGGNPARGNKVIGDRLPYSSSILFDNPKGGGGGIGVYVGDIHDSYKAVRITNNIISYNEAHSGGGIEFYAGAFGIVQKCNIDSNKTRPEIPYSPFPLGGDGGGIAVNSTALNTAMPTYAVVKIQDSFIDGNEAFDDGGGVYGTANAYIEIKKTIISGNTAHNNGGGIRVSFGSSLKISDESEVIENLANQAGGKGGGGGIAVRNSYFEINNCILRGNTVQNFGGGGIYIVTLLEGGSVFPGVPDADDILTGTYGYTRSRIFIKDSNVFQNIATGAKGAGGGIYMVYDEYDIGVDIKNSSFGSNVSNHADANKKKNIVFEDNSSFADPLINDTDFTSGISPIVSYNNTLSP